MSTQFLSNQNHKFIYGILSESIQKKKSIKINNKYVNLLSRIMKQVYTNTNDKSNIKSMLIRAGFSEPEFEKGDFSDSEIRLTAFKLNSTSF